MYIPKDMYEYMLSSLSVKDKNWRQANVLSCFSRVQLCNPMDCGPWSLPSTPEAPLFMRYSQQEYWSGLLCPPPGDLPNPGIKLTSLVLQADTSLLSHSLGKPQNKLEVEQK